jgi:uncharacterized membrane protein YphA (DoxX/SURF4 family)
MNILLWVIQILVALAFFGHGWLFLSPPADLVDIMNESFAPWFRIFLGVAEWLGAAGLILPGLTRILPQLTSWAAVGLGTIVALATILHLTRGEYSSAAMTAVLFALCAFVAYMRWKVKPVVSHSAVPVTNA